MPATFDDWLKREREIPVLLNKWFVRTLYFLDREDAKGEIYLQAMVDFLGAFRNMEEATAALYECEAMELGAKRTEGALARYAKTFFQLSRIHPLAIVVHNDLTVELEN